MEKLFVILAVLAILFTLIRQVRKDHWTIRFFDFPIVQITVLTLFIMAGFIYFTETWSIIKIVTGLVLLGCILYNAWVIFPYTFLASKETNDLSHPEDEDREIGILVSNVYMENREYDRLLNLIEREDPDIIITLETDKRWEKALSVLKETYPWYHEIPLSNMYGMHLYSRFPLSDLHERYLIQKGVPSVRCKAELPSGNKFTLYSVHPKPPSPTENDFSTARDGELYKIAMETSDRDEPIIVAGDLNDVAWSHSTRLFNRISGLLDPRKGRGFFNTFNANIPLLRWPLDHIFHSTHFELKEMRKLPGIGSDHFPIGVKLHFTGKKQPADQEKADQEDRMEAVEKIEEAEE